MRTRIAGAAAALHAALPLTSPGFSAVSGGIGCCALAALIALALPAPIRYRASSGTETESPAGPEIASLIATGTDIATVTEAVPEASPDGPASVISCDARIAESDGAK